VAQRKNGRHMRTERTVHRDLYSGLIRLHILHHACEEQIFGLGMIEELGRHGYKLSPGTLYPLLHSLEERGLLASKEKREGRSYRKVYRATRAGRKAMIAAKEKVRELFGEVFEPPPGRAPRKSPRLPLRAPHSNPSTTCKVPRLRVVL
jgi:PadR family transcriptional regulator, regulatory protein PadR